MFPLLKVLFQNRVTNVTEQNLLQHLGEKFLAIPIVTECVLLKKKYINKKVSGDAKPY